MNAIACPKCQQSRPATQRPCWNCGHTPGTVVKRQPVASTAKKPFTSSTATAIAIVIVFSILAIGTSGFLKTPAGQEQWQKISQIISSGIDNASHTTGLLSGGDFTCPPGITKLEFDNEGVLKEPYPQLQPEPQRFCFDREKYLAFIGATGITESGREITGLDWLSETIAYPDYPSLLETVKAALEKVEVSQNLPNVGWIELPGYGQTQPNSSDDNLPPGSWVPLTQPTATPTTTSTTEPPTSTPMPTVPAAEIPTLAPSTPMPQQESILNHTPEPTQAVVLATAKVDVLQQNCVTVVDGTDFWNLDQLAFWSQGVTFLEFRLGEDGAYAQSNKVGGDGPDAYKHWACVRQIFNWPGNTINLKNGIVGQWDGAQVRVNPLYGVGDWISNGIECGANGLWLFQCSVTYPPGTPTPTPAPLPTHTPVSNYTVRSWIDHMGGAGVAQGTYYLKSCGGFNGPVVQMSANCYDGNHLIDWSEVISLIDTSKQVYLGPCRWFTEGWSLENVPHVEYNDMNWCLGPTK